MIIDLPATTTSEIAKRLIAVREEGGAVALGRVLTLLIVTGDETDEAAIAAANEASSEHPMRVIVLERAPEAGEARLDAEIRVGGDAGASEVIRLRATGEAAADPETLVQGLLLPDAPVVTWWTAEAVDRPSAEPLGRIAQLRITDCVREPDGSRAIANLAEGFSPGDSDLAWTRLTAWRALLASVLDQPPYDAIREARVTGRAGAATSILMAGWLALALRVPVSLDHLEAEEWFASTGLPADAEAARELHAGLFSVVLRRDGGEVALRRLSDETIELLQTDLPPQKVAVPLSDLSGVLREELRSLAPDRFLGRVLREGVPLVRDGNRDRMHGAEARALDAQGIAGGEGAPA